MTLPSLIFCFFPTCAAEIKKQREFYQKLGMEVPGDIKGELCNIKTHLDQRNGTISPTLRLPAVFIITENIHTQIVSLVSCWWHLCEPKPTIGGFSWPTRCYPVQHDFKVVHSTHGGNGMPEGVAHLYYVVWVMCWRSVGVSLAWMVKQTHKQQIGAPTAEYIFQEAQDLPQVQLTQD